MNGKERLSVAPLVFHKSHVNWPSFFYQIILARISNFEGHIKTLFNISAEIVAWFSKGNMLPISVRQIFSFHLFQMNELGAFLLQLLRLCATECWMLGRL